MMGRFLSAVGDYLYAALVALVVAGVLLWAIGLTIARGQTTPLDGTMTFTGDTHYTPPTLSLGDFHAEKLSRDEVKALFAARQAVLQAQEKLDAVEDATKRAHGGAVAYTIGNFNEATCLHSRTTVELRGDWALVTTDTAAPGACF